MDSTDLRILSLLQGDGHMQMARLADKVGLSLSACHRRVKLLEKSGHIAGYAARIDRKAVGLEIQVFVEVKLTSQRAADIEAFEAAIRDMPEVLECHLISGEFDYLIRVAARNTEAYDTLYRRRLSSIPAIRELRTSMCLSTVKEFSGYYLD